MIICRVFIWAICLGLFAACTTEPDGTRALPTGGPTLEECLHRASGVYFVRVEQDANTARLIVEEVWRHDPLLGSAPSVGTELNQQGEDHHRIGGTEIPDHAIVFRFQPPLKRASRSEAMVFDGYVRTFDLTARRLRDLVQSTVREPMEPLELHPVGKPVPSRPAITGNSNPNRTSPRAISKVLPVYPREFRVRGIGGEALIEVQVMSDGSVGATHIVYATDLRFGEAAEKCIRQWRFAPATKNGQPIDARMQIPIVFTMQ